jgi:ketosteroid isomerase-like protein
MSGAPSATDTAALVETYFEAVQSGDRSVFERLFADDITYHYPGKNPYAAVYHGKTEIFAYLDRLRDDTDGSLTVSVDEVMTGDGVAAARVRPRAERKGRELEWSMIIFFRLEAGEIKQIVLHYADQYAFDSWASD